MLVGLLAFAEGRTDDIHYLRDGNREDVLEELDHETIDRIAYRLYAEDTEHLSAYERLLKDDKRKKMDYINNIRPDLIPDDREREYAHEPVAHHGEDHHTVDDIPKPDPSKESIRDRVLREQKRRQNDLMEAKRLAEEESKAEEAHHARAEELAKLTPEEREEKLLKDKWRREYERE